MRRVHRGKLIAALLSLTVVGSGTIVSRLRADDEPKGLFGRLFRAGNKPSNKDVEAKTKPRTNSAGRTGQSSSPHTVGASGTQQPAAGYSLSNNGLDTFGSFGSSPYASNPSNPYGGAAGPGGNRGVATMAGSGTPNSLALPTGGAGPRLVPQPRVSRPVTEAPPVLTRIQLGRSDDGRTFGMFLQVYADGTVVDTEGVHRVGADVMRPLLEALRAADVGRIKGHCGNPPVDYIEQTMLIVYDQSRGRLQANSFSYSGNTQGCDQSIHALQAAIDAVQAKIGPAPVTTPALDSGANHPQGTGGRTLPLPAPDADTAPPPELLSPTRPSTAAPPLRLTPDGGL